MLRVGIVGLGCMGAVHLKRYQQLELTDPVAICDIDAAKFDNPDKVLGNIRSIQDPINLSGITLYHDIDQMIAEANLDAVSVTVPTYLHRDLTIKLLNAGLHVLCEKPMAMDAQQCIEMIDCARKNDKILQVGHVIRFWPEYVKTKSMIDSGKYGKLQAAYFKRLSAAPKWSHNNWLMDGNKSGGALFDLHIHDADFIHYLFGLPRTVTASGTRGESGQFDHIMCSYNYDSNITVTAEGSWMMVQGYPFEMGIRIQMEKATIVLDNRLDPMFRVYEEGKEFFTPELPQGDGYYNEIKTFAQKIMGQSVPDIITSEESMKTICLMKAEIESAATAQPVKVVAPQM